jgi:hypothetical protein
MNLVRSDATTKVSILVSSPEFDSRKKSTTDLTLEQNVQSDGPIIAEFLDPDLMLGPCPSLKNVNFSNSN